MTRSTKPPVREALVPLLGLKLTRTLRFMDMRIVHFARASSGAAGPSPKGTFALHLQGPWRLERDGALVTGSADLWVPAYEDEEIDRETWNYQDHPNLQDRRITEVFGARDATARAWLNATDLFVVEGITVDECGSFALSLTGGYRLLMFPAGSFHEDWRMFSLGDDDSHFVIVGGQVYVPPPESSD